MSQISTVIRETCVVIKISVAKLFRGEKKKRKKKKQRAECRRTDRPEERFGWHMIQTQYE